MQNTLDKIGKKRQIHLKTKWMLLADNWMFSKNLEKALADIEEAVAGIGEPTTKSK